MEHKQNEPIFLMTSIGNLDGTADFEDDVGKTFDKIEDAIKTAKDIVTEYGMKAYIYKCVPVCRITRGKIRVDKL